jgi:HSP20 family protein
MSEEVKVMKKENRADATVETPEARALQAPLTDTIYVPDVDIREDSDQIRLEANMPGVDPASVDVHIEKGVLTIEGRAQFEPPQGCKLIGMEYGVGRYRRDFTLADSIETEKIVARVRQGVLQVTLPKREHVKTRRVKIES